MFTVYTSVWKIYWLIFWFSWMAFSWRPPALGLLFHLTIFVLHMCPLAHLVMSIFVGHIKLMWLMMCSSCYTFTVWPTVVWCDQCAILRHHWLFEPSTNSASDCSSLWPSWLPNWISKVAKRWGFYHCCGIWVLNFLYFCPLVIGINEKCVIIHRPSKVQMDDAPWAVVVVPVKLRFFSKLLLCLMTGVTFSGNLLRAPVYAIPLGITAYTLHCDHYTTGPACASARVFLLLWSMTALNQYWGVQGNWLQLAGFCNLFAFSSNFNLTRYFRNPTIWWTHFFPGNRDRSRKCPVIPWNTSKRKPQLGAANIWSAASWDFLSLRIFLG